MFAARTTAVSAFAAFLIVLAAGAGRAEEYGTKVSLLDTTTTNMGQAIAYPRKPARVVSAIVTLAPGEETGRHLHPVPTFGYVLEGEVTVGYAAAGEKIYHAGEAFMEAQGIWHNGRNSGRVPTRILVVFMGADGVANVERPR
ncbi:MAG TPA: cupin domain-containing protein [Alphaproteobacteria bacterium]|jgi:quercetin dioxygenase-like cupin family protein|nr:cupin domain-containing protein [Alphaproteobacteria bacterium]